MVSTPDGRRAAAAADAAASTATDASRIASEVDDDAGAADATGGSESRPTDERRAFSLPSDAADVADDDEAAVLGGSLSNGEPRPLPAFDGVLEPLPPHAPGMSTFCIAEKRRLLLSIRIPVGGGAALSSRGGNEATSSSVADMNDKVKRCD